MIYIEVSCVLARSSSNVRDTTEIIGERILTQNWFVSFDRFAKITRRLNDSEKWTDTCVHSGWRWPTSWWPRACRTLGEQLEGPGPISTLVRGTSRGSRRQAGGCTSIANLTELIWAPPIRRKVARQSHGHVNSTPDMYRCPTSLRRCPT